VEADLEPPPNEDPPGGLRSSLRHLSPGGWDVRSSCLLLPHRSGSGGGACPELSVLSPRLMNFGTYFPGVGAAAAAAAAGIAGPDSNGWATALLSLASLFLPVLVLFASAFQLSRPVLLCAQPALSFASQLLQVPRPQDIYIPLKKTKKDTHFCTKERNAGSQ